MKVRDFIFEEEQNYEDMSAEEIYETGEWNKNFDSKKGLDVLIKKDKTGEWIYWAGRYWKQFDYKKGLDALIKVDKTGEWIYIAGAGNSWKIFNYERGFKALKKLNNKWYKYALKEWPKSVEETKEMIDIKTKNVKTETPKKLKLKS